jgi:hypothetical protein
LQIVADAVILRTLHKKFKEPLPGVSTQTLADSLDFLFNYFDTMTGYGGDKEYQWMAVRE